MADSMIQLSPDSTGKKVDTEELTVGLNSVHRERMQIAGDDATDIAPVTAADGLTVNLGTNNDVSLNAGTNNIGDVDVLTVPAPLSTAGGGTEATALRVTVASDSTGVLSVDDNGGSLTVDGTVAVSGVVDTELPAAAALADNAANPTAPAVGAFGMVWDGVTWDRAAGTSADGALVNLGANNDVSLNAGTNNIGDVDIASLPDEGQQTMAGSISVAIASDQSTVPVSLASGGTTQYAEDSVHVSGDQVTMAGVVQQTADAALGADGDRSLLQVDSSGFLKVNIKAGAGSGGTAMADDAAFTPAVTQGTPAFAVADEVTPDSVDEGDAGALRMTLDRKLLTRIVGATDADRLDVDASGHAQIDIAAASVTVPISAASLPLPTGAATAAAQLPDGHAVTVDNAAGAAAVNVQDGGNSLTVDGSVSITGVVDTELPAAAALADATANPTTPLIGAALETFNGTTWDRARGDTTNGLDVDVTRLPSLVAGTANIGDVDVLTVPAPLSTTGGGTEATALRVTVASDSTGVLSVDDNGGALTVDGTVTANQGTAGTAWEVVGDVAADVAVPANPLSIGGRASTAVPTAVSADGDSVYAWLNRLGMQVVSAIPGLGLNADPHTLLSETAQYTTTQTSTALVAGGAGERIVVTSIQLQAGGTTAATVQVYFGTGAYARGTDEALFDGEFAPSATLKPGFYAAPPSGFRAGALGDDILVTTSAGITLTVTVWYYILGV